MSNQNPPSTNTNTTSAQDPLYHLKQAPTWSPSRTIKGKQKAPHHKIDEPDTFQTFEAAKALQPLLVDKGHESLFLGVMAQANDPYIYIDIDIDPSGNDPKKHTSISPEVLSLLEQFPTYTEISPSGNGLHIIYKLSARDAATLRTLGFTKMSSTSTKAPYTGELIFSGAYLIITERPYFTPQHPIAQVGMDVIFQYMPKLKQRLVQNITPKSNQPNQSANKKQESKVIGMRSRQPLNGEPLFEDIQRQLLRLPTRLDFYVTKAYAQLETPLHPNNYDHWVNVCMCLAHAALSQSFTDVAIHNLYYELFDFWSSRDTEAYKGPDDTWDKWESVLRSTKEKMEQNDNYKPALTKSTLFRLVNLCYPKYPVRDHQKNEVLWESHHNLQAVIDFHQLIFKADVYDFSTLYVECHKDVERRLFNGRFQIEQSEKPDHVLVFLKTPELAFRIILEESYYKVPAIQRCLAPFKQLAVQNINIDLNINIHDRFKAWVESKPWDGTPRVDQVISTLEFDPHEDPTWLEHYKKGLRKCLLWLVGSRYLGKPSSPPCVPILVGTEGIYKSTWVKSLLHDTPFALQYVRTVSGLLNDRRELSRALQGTLIALIDEIETSLTNADKAKDILSEETLNIRAHYENSYVNIPKLGLIFGTTNNPYMTASDDGNRRYLRIRVLNCDTDALWKIDMQQVYAELLVEYKEHVKKGNKMPWVFTKEENRMNNIIMGYAAAKSEEAHLLEEYFGGPPESFEFNESLYIGPRGGFKQNHVLLKEGLATTVSKMANDLFCFIQSQNFNAPVKHIKRPVLKRKLQAFAAKYTQTEHKSRTLGNITCLNGMVFVKHQTLFLVPRRRED